MSRTNYNATQQTFAVKDLAGILMIPNQWKIR